ncbi:MAG TPA: metal ABC transporter permease [Candidatus Binataceae bacterium]|nr:metal ABC transporter permease [Candidatus Binataceae bacterium]
METRALVLSTEMAVAAGTVGCFAVMRKMTLAADAFSHVALPGIGLALVMRLNPLLGAVAALMLGALIIWGVENRTGISTETITGVVFSLALAIGSMMASGEELIDALFGAPGALSNTEATVGLVGGAAVIAFMLFARDRLLISMVSAEVAATSGINVRRLNLAYLAAFALTVALGLRYLGVLLMGSLIIIPAATAKRIARNINGMLAIAVGVSVASTLLGTLIAASIHRPTGPIIITIAGALFFLSLAWR